MDISIGLDQLIKELKEKTSSHQDFNKILEFYEMNEYGLTFEWICADFIENDLPVSETGKMNLMNIFNHLNVESEKEWAELDLENKLKALKAVPDLCSSPLNFPCPCCGFLTKSVKAIGSFEICPVCKWEDDAIQFEDPSFEGGANGPSLTQARQNYKDFGASAIEFKNSVRPPRKSELP